MSSEGSKAPKDSEPPFFAYIAELHRAVHALDRFLNVQLDASVSQPEALIIMHLARRPTSTINELHRAFLHRRSTLTSVVDRLEDKSLVERGFARGDRRNVNVKLTTRGARVADAIAHAFDQLRSGVESSLTITDRDVIRLHTLAERASSMASEGDGKR